jgi:hypothetical protein
VVPTSCVVRDWSRKEKQVGHSGESVAFRNKVGFEKSLTDLLSSRTKRYQCGGNSPLTMRATFFDQRHKFSINKAY